MIDYFALFGEPRRPWLDPGALKEKFLGLSAGVHPDRVHAASEAVKAAAHRRYTALAAAYQLLREPRERLGHWLALERGVKPQSLQTVSSPMQSFLFETGQLLRAADELLREKSRLNSPLLKVQFFERSQTEIEKLKATLQQIAAHQDALLAELKSLDEAWIGRPSAESKPDGEIMPFIRLEEIYHVLGFLGRSTGQLRERVLQIGL